MRKGHERSKKSKEKDRYKATPVSASLLLFLLVTPRYCHMLNSSVHSSVSCPDARKRRLKEGRTLSPLEKEITNN